MELLSSPVIDVAIVKLPDDLYNLQACRWFDSSQLKIAEELYTFGWPNESGGDSTVTKGIYSRTNKYDDGTEYIQTDAAINPGNSGGPLVNDCGVVGIDSSKQVWSNQNTPSEGFGFALSSNYIHGVIDNLILEGNLSKGIPSAKNYQIAENTPNNSNNYSLNVDDIRIYLNDIYRAKSSWEQARGHVDDSKLNMLLDSFERQIQFCNHLISKLSDGRAASQDDIFMWKSINKMSYESSALSQELNRR